MRQNDLWTCKDKEVPGQIPCLSTTLVVSLFKKEEEEVRIVSDVANVVATPGSLRRDRARWHVGVPFCGYELLGPPLRNPRDRNDSPILQLIYRQLRNI